MIEEIRDNVETAIKILNELAEFAEKAENSVKDDKKLLLDAIESLAERVKIINRSIPYLLKEVSLARQLSDKPKGKHETIVDTGSRVTLSGSDKRDYIDKLNISENLIRKLRKKILVEDNKSGAYTRPNLYARISNRFFLKISDTQIKRGNFKSLSLDLRRSNLNILTTTYLSMMFLSTVLAFFSGIALLVVLTFVQVSPGWPMIGLHTGDFIMRFIKLSWMIIAIPLATFGMFILYPNGEKKSLAKRIDQELPFVVIHMGSIAGSGIDPIEIFKIIGLSKEYKYTGNEIKKILNQTNLYGYDLTNSLRNVGRATPSQKLAELLNGISVTINSGGDIKAFLEKRAESLLLEYRLDREKSIKVAETFMDIYISIVIATPMILMLLLVMISVSGISTGLGLTEMSILIIGIVSLINIIFLAFLHFKQPSY
jgi:pilus assembly protein TadC